MVSLEDLERPPVRAALAFLVLLEIYLIVTRFRAGFEDYLTLVVVFLSLPLAYFAFHFLVARQRNAKTYEAVIRSALPADASEETRLEVEKLLASAEYQEYERKRQAGLRRRLEGEAGAEGGEEERELEEVALELEELEEEIFDI